MNNTFVRSLNKFISKNDDFAVRNKDITLKDLERYLFKYNGMFITDSYYILGPVTAKVHDKIADQDEYLRKYKVTDCVLPVKCTMYLDNHYYIAYEAIPMIGYSTTNKDIKINNVVQLNSRLPNKSIYESTEFSHYIYSVCVCYSLGIGVDFMESLYDTKTKNIHIINRGLDAKSRDDEYFYFTKKVIKKYNMYDYTSKIHGEIAAKLEDLNSKKFKDTIKKLVKYSDKKVSHRMAYDIYTNKVVTTYSGYKIPEIRLALAYYVREQDPDNAIKCMLELLRIDNYPMNKVAKLLCKVAIEEVGIADPDVVIYTLRYMTRNKLTTDRLIDILYTLATGGTSRRVTRMIIKHDVNIPTKRENSLSKYMDKCESTFNIDTNKVTNAICKFEFWYEKERNSKCVYYINRIHYMAFASNIRAKIDNKNVAEVIWNTMGGFHDYVDSIHKAYIIMYHKKYFTVFCALLHTELDNYEYETPALEDGEEYYDLVKKPYKFKISNEVRKALKLDEEDILESDESGEDSYGYNTESERDSEESDNTNGESEDDNENDEETDDFDFNIEPEDGQDNSEQDADDNDSDAE